MEKRLLVVIAAALVAGTAFPATAGTITDADMDGVFDPIDNCSSLANSTQTDTDGDFCGNRCDADFDQDGTVGAADFSSLVAAFGGPGIPPGLQDIGSDPPDGTVGAADFSQLVSGFGGPPGPSGLTPGTVACP